MSAIAEVQAGAEAAKSVEEAVSGAFHCAADCLDTTIKMKHEIEAENHSDAEIYTMRESYVKDFLDKIVKLAGEKFNIIVVREYQADIASFEEARPHMPLFEVEYESGKFDHYRVYLFTKGKYQRVWPGGSWKGDGIQWYPSVVAKYPINGQMYLEDFPEKPGMTEEERKAAASEQADQENEAKNQELDEQSERDTQNQLAAQEREQNAQEALGTNGEEQQGEQPAEEQPAEEQAQPAEEQPAEEQPTEEQPAEEQPAEEQPEGEE